MGYSAMNWDETSSPNPTSAGIFCIAPLYYNEQGYSHISSRTDNNIIIMQNLLKLEIDILV